MERKDLKKMLAGVGFATLMAGGVVAFTPAPALSA